MARPTISVVIPAHPPRIKNGKLQQALDSVYAQTLLPDAVCLAIDNDGEGAAPTRDRALRQARTDWVAFLDSDDLFLPRHLELMLNWVEREQADFVYSWFKLLQEAPDGSTTILEDDPIFPMTHYTDDWDPANPVETTITTMVRTDLALEVGMIALDRGQVNSGEDARFTLECAARGARITHLKRKTWLWRHGWIDEKTMANTSGLPGRGDWNQRI